jgi:AraC-like DNA-binding protein
MDPGSIAGKLHLRGRRRFDSDQSGRRYLRQLFAGSGTSFVQELTATRLDRASDMLSDPRAGGLSVGEIAYRCGFLDPGYFARAFRKRFGRTPSEWRGASSTRA